MSKKQRNVNVVPGWKFPDFHLMKLNSPTYQHDITNALNYAAYVYSPADMTNFTRQFASDNSLDIADVPEWELVGPSWISYLAVNKAEISLEKQQETLARLRVLIEKYKKPVVVKKASVINDNDPSNLLIGELEELLDSIVLWDGESELKEPDVILQGYIGRKLATKVIRTRFQNQKAQLDDPDFSEFFERMSETDMERLGVGLEIILNALDNFVKSGNDAAVPKSRTKSNSKVFSKPIKINPTRMVKKLQHLKTFKDDFWGLELKSVPAEKIIGASFLWVYNTRQRKLGRYVSKTDAGLFVKGSMILNFDETASVQKTLRDPTETLGRLVNAGKIEQRTFMNDLKTATTILNGRINKDCVLMRVF